MRTLVQTKNQRCSGSLMNRTSLAIVREDWLDHWPAGHDACRSPNDEASRAAIGLWHGNRDSPQVAHAESTRSSGSKEPKNRRFCLRATHNWTRHTRNQYSEFLEEIMSVQQEERRLWDRRGQSAEHCNGRRASDEYGQRATKRDAHSQTPTPTDRYWSVLEKVAPEE